jgi:metallopeptidase MepB
MAASDELRQIWLSVYDMQIHGLTKPEDADTINVSELMNRDRLDITKFPSHESLSDPPDFLWGNFETTFTHIMDNYVAKYWAYTWSRVNAKDVFYTRFAQDPLSKTTGREFREKVLAPGSSRNLTSLYVDFLGRPPNNQAYLKDLGLDM